MLRTTLAGLRLHKSRYVTTVLAILLGVMFVSGTLVFADTLEASYEESVMGSATSVDAIAVPEAEEGEDEDGFPLDPVPFGDAVLDDIRALPEVADADGLVRGQAVLLDAEGRAFGFTPPAAIGLGETSRFSASEGELPAADDEIALATSTSSQTGFEVGDTVTVLDPDQDSREFTVTGLVNFGVDPSYSYGGAVVFAQDTVEEMTGASGYSEINVMSTEGTTDEDAAAAVATVTGTDVQTGAEFGEAMAEASGSETAILRIALLLFGVIAMFVAGIVIYNTFAILIAQRQRELALLRCVGAKRGQIFRSVLTESFVVGLFASVLGVLAGTGIGALGARFGGQLMGTGATASLVVSPTAVIVGLLVGTLMTVFSALIPATRATRVAPLAALRTSATAAGLEKGTGWMRVVFGLVAFAVSAALVGLSQSMSPDPNGLFVVTGAALVAFVGVVVLGPLLVRGIVRVIGIPLRRVGVPSMLAVDNSTRSPRRAATAMIALTVGATLITGYSVISASFESTMTKQLDESFPVDYQVSAQYAPDGPATTAGTEAEAAEEEALEQGAPEEGDTAQGTPEDGAAEGPGSGEGAVDEGGAVEGEAVDEETGTPLVPREVEEKLSASPLLDKVISERSTYLDDFTDLDSMGLPVSAYFGAEMGVDMRAETVEGDLDDFGTGKVLLTESYADGTGVGDTITLPAPGGDLDLEVAAVLENGAAFWGAVITPTDFTAAFPSVEEGRYLHIQAAEGTDPAEVREAVYAAVDDYPMVQVMSVAEMKNQFSEMMNIAFYTIAAMLGLAIIIAVFGISNTMALSVLERTRESALLRALGLAKGQLRRMLSVEAVLLCLIGAGIGIALGVLFGWAAGAAILPGLVFSIPTAQITVFIAIAVLAGLLAAVLPARRAAGTSITGALASE
ncbi:FtsX-like permease family protein [Nocardiopsis exhalans]|uniref:FtsX-like permease family protein n=2 Tax=Nocardiopsis TaxID=2013 RepID=A0ABY5D2I7_9ACTN|nr:MULTISPECIES: FtsX-like permease family protein [Nocardiopsis]MBB5491059.1 putative ABC transport system permease protein [Nocardiopsis metallicus]USY17635.1 FtsX-like permease family protein [Nocardiopsis exhalans]